MKRCALRRRRNRSAVNPGRVSETPDAGRAWRGRAHRRDHGVAFYLRRCARGFWRRACRSAADARRADVVCDLRRRSDDPAGLRRALRARLTERRNAIDGGAARRRRDDRIGSRFQGFAAGYR